MKKQIIRKLIDYCCKQAHKYEQRKEMLLNLEKSVDFIYSIGCNIHRRDEWLNRIKTLQNKIT